LNSFYIAIRHLFKKNKHGFISFSIFSSIIGISIGVSLLIIVDSFTNGFNQIIDNKLSKIDGHIRVTNIGDKKNFKLDSLYLNRDVSINIFISNYAIISNNNNLNNTLIYGIKNNDLDNTFNIESFLHSGSSYLGDSSDIIIGYKLAEILNISLNEEIILYNLDEIQEDNIFNARTFKVVGMLKTGFPEYDKVLTFMNFDDVSTFFNTKSASIGKIINFNSNFNLIEELKSIKELLNPFYFHVQSWKDRHSQLYEWLSVYYVPIYFVMISIIVLGICNILISLKLIIENKKNNLAIIKTMGFSDNQICMIIINQGILISMIGSLIGILIALVILNIQNKFKIITLSSDVYFIDYLPASINYSIIFIILIFTIIFTFFISFLALRKIYSQSTSQILRYE